MHWRNNWIAELGKIQFTELYYYLCAYLQKENYLVRGEVYLYWRRLFQSLLQWRRPLYHSECGLYSSRFCGVVNT